MKEKKINFIENNNVRPKNLLEHQTMHLIRGGDCDHHNTGTGDCVFSNWGGGDCDHANYTPTREK